MRIRYRMALIAPILLAMSISALCPIALASQNSVRLQGCVNRSYEVMQGNGFVETYFIVNYDNENYQIGLGLTLTHMNSGIEINDGANDRVISLNFYQSGSFDRYFVIPSYAPKGWYTITCAIWMGRPGYGMWLDSQTIPQQIYIGNYP
jgi:hypothetical protein